MNSEFDEESAPSSELKTQKQIQALFERTHHRPGLWEQLLSDEEPIHRRKGCKCSKTGCLKLYCECFTRGELCGQSCSCNQCVNTTKHTHEVFRARAVANWRHPGLFVGLPIGLFAKKCTCKKSQCRKKYCECFNAGVKCTNACDCQQCHNAEECPGIAEIK